MGGKCQDTQKKSSTLNRSGGWLGRRVKGSSPIHSRNDLEWLRRLTVARCDIGSISLAFKLTSNLVEDNGGFARHGLDL